MGMLTITVNGSFGCPRTKTFSAMKVGHAGAVAEALKYLTEIELPVAIHNDHKCQRDGIEPSEGFGGMGKILTPAETPTAT